MAESEPAEETFPVRVAARMSGLKPELIRAWEQRHGAVEPARTAGGTRRYSRRDVERLDLLRRVVHTGHRIGNVAALSEAELEARLATVAGGSPSALGEDLIESLIGACDRHDTAEIRTLLGERLSSLGPVDFALDVALPFMHRVGAAWEEGSLGIASEHLATAVVRAFLLDLIQPAPEGKGAPRLIFAAPSSERHDLGLLAAAVVANQSGAEIIFLGADMPEEDLRTAAAAARVEAVVLGIVCLPNAHDQIKDVRKALPKSVSLWIGGAGIAGLPPISGVERLVHFRDLEAFVAELRFPRSEVTP